MWAGGGSFRLVVISVEEMKREREREREWLSVDQLYRCVRACVCCPRICASCASRAMVGREVGERLESATHRGAADGRRHDPVGELCACGDGGGGHRALSELCACGCACVSVCVSVCVCLCASVCCLCVCLQVGRSLPPSSRKYFGKYLLMGVRPSKRRSWSSV